MIAFITGKRTKWVVLVIWVLILGASGGVANKLMSVEKNDAISFLSPQPSPPWSRTWPDVSRAERPRPPSSSTTGPAA